jgi:hypothetical protein
LKLAIFELPSHCMRVRPVSCCSIYSSAPRQADTHRVTPISAQLAQYYP